MGEVVELRAKAAPKAPAVPTLFCIFCGASDQEVDHFVRGVAASACLCDRCVDSCAEIIAIKRSGFQP